MNPQAKALRDAFRRIIVQGTSGHASGHGPPYEAPWMVIDTDFADVDVGFPGDLISEHETADEADDARWEAVLVEWLKAVSA